MTLEEAIEYIQAVADGDESECELDHEQLANWLRELQELRDEVEEYRQVEQELSDNPLYLEAKYAACGS